MDQEKRMLDKVSLTSVSPIEFEEHEGRTFHVKHFVSNEDLIVQVFPKQKIDVIGGRVAKAVIDTVGESGMDKISIELHDDPSIASYSAIFVKCSGLGTDFYKDSVTSTLLQNLDQCLTAKQV